KQGMVFRCDQDFKNVEVLGHNFRNNYEVGVDSYGTMWQSDNDDDGNKGVRINYVMEYGNYGYTDEMTGAGWSVNRTNIEEQIPHRHWHLNDPGVVPNLLQTGAGSPTGLLVYEGDMMPKIFQNQVIHCDAGPNVVRAYPVEKDGAGYKATIANLIYGKRNQWFRPADVCAAPDGSLFAADWYDPGVGGHQAGDLNRGRIYRVAPPNIAYKVPTFDFNTLGGALAALQNPNVSVRYLAYNKIRSMGANAESELAKMYQTHANPRMKARALWLLSKLPNGSKYIETALKDSNPDLRITALRAARQVTAKGVLPLTPEQLLTLANDPDPQVRREMALALRHQTDDLAADLWAQLANRHDGQDRWYLEALGIAADGQWDKFFKAWLKTAGPSPTATAKGRDIVWRARTPESVPLLASLASDANVPLKNRLRYFRAFDFNPAATEKSNALLGILKSSNDNEITKLCLRHLDPGFVKTSPEAQQSLQKLLDATFGTSEYMELVQRFEPTNENKRLLQIATEKPMQGIGRDASRQLLKQNGTPLLWATINGKDAVKAQSVITSLRNVGNKASLDILKSVALDPKRPKALRMEAARAIGGSWDGEELVLALLKEGKLTGDYKAAAVQGVSSAWRKSVRQEAASYLDAAPTKSGKKLPPMSELIAMKGDLANGKTVFANYCATCHQINGEGADFGPGLSEIGSKLGKDGQYMAIFYPSAGVSFGYEGYEVKFKDGSTTIGIVASKTETDLILKFPGGTTQSYKMTQVASMKKLDESLMTAGLHEAMSQQQLVDLVEYLASLKRK
ncbi:MAG: PVC-type heme-binding CxxCH protein, partial [Runella sp.]